MDAVEAGLFMYWIGRREIICVPRPSLSLADGRLHREDGPAVVWASGEQHWFWRGTEVPAWLIEQPDSITADDVSDERDLQRRMVQRIGAERPRPHRFPSF